MIPATTTSTTDKHADQPRHDTAAGEETTAARKPPQHETEETEHEQTGQEGSKRYRWDDPEIQALAANGAVPDAALAARLGRMLGLARDSARPTRHS